MRKFWMNSIPLIAVLLVMAFGFTLVSHAANCDALKKACDDATQAAQSICNALGNGSPQCIDAQRLAGEVCYEYYNQCHS